MCARHKFKSFVFVLERVDFLVVSARLLFFYYCGIVKKGGIDVKFCATSWSFVRANIWSIAIFDEVVDKHGSCIFACLGGENNPFVIRVSRISSFKTFETKNFL